MTPRSSSSSTRREAGLPSLVWLVSGSAAKTARYASSRQGSSAPEGRLVFTYMSDPKAVRVQDGWTDRMLGLISLSWKGSGTLNLAGEKLECTCSGVGGDPDESCGEVGHRARLHDVALA